jgi:hypothetical protein
MECPRAEFIGMLNLADPSRPGHPASGFDHWASYYTLVGVMSMDREAGDFEVTVQEMRDQKG